MKLHHIFQKEEKNTSSPKYFSCASLEKNTRKWRCLSWKWGVGKGDGKHGYNI